jgi:HK97 family phage prohead protease
MTEEISHFDNPAPGHGFSVDVNSRTITGRATVYGVPAISNGVRFQFSKGSLKWDDVSRVKLLMAHERSAAVGKAIALEDREDGLYATFKVARGPEGDRALLMAEDGVWDGLSIGTRSTGAQYDHRDGIYHAKSVPLAEISLTPDPAFSDARVSSVTAQADDERNTPMPETAETVQAPGADFSALTNAITSAFAGLAPAQPAAPEGREVVQPVATLSVSEEPMYRFDGGHSKFDFSSDLIDGLKDGNREALTRVNEFMAATFDVDVADGAALNPNRNRPDLYVDQREYQYPLWEAVRKGTLADKTPFVLPKFSSSSGLVAAHTEGVEPTPGTFVATSQTITPSPVSGKVEITREVWDQGGSPQLSSIIFRQMVRAYYEALEASVVTTLDAASPTGITITTAAADKALAKEITTKFSALQFVRGGFRFDTMATQIDLYQTLVAAVDDNGRPLFPIYAPQNANGQSQPLLASVNVAGQRAFPSWALAATGTVAASSYLFDRESVHGWASAPERLEFQYRVAYVDLAVWGYKAVAITDLTGVREVIYDPA